MKKVLESFDMAAFSFVSFQHLNIFDVRSKQRIPQNSKTAIAIIFPYYNKSAFCGNVSAYCAVADYHIVVMEQLKSIISALQEKYPHNSFAPFVDSSPIDEVDMAVKGGLGVKGHNSLLITEKWGSFVFIGEIITDLEWETVLCDYKYCIGCGLCEKHCPGRAISVQEVTEETAEGCTLCGEEFSAESRASCGEESAAENPSDNRQQAKGERRYIKTENCASFISQKKQELTAEETAILGRAKTVFGCDICQKVCPHNRKLFDGSAESAGQENLFSGDIFHTVTAENVADVYKQRAFGFRGLKVLERNLKIYGEETL